MSLFRSATASRASTRSRQQLTVLPALPCRRPADGIKFRSPRDNPERADIHSVASRWATNNDGDQAMKKTILVAAAILTTVSSVALAQAASTNSTSAPAPATANNTQASGSEPPTAIDQQSAAVGIHQHQGGAGFVSGAGQRQVGQPGDDVHWPQLVDRSDDGRIERQASDSNGGNTGAFRRHVHQPAGQGGTQFESGRT